MQLTQVRACGVRGAGLLPQRARPHCLRCSPACRAARRPPRQGPGRLLPCHACSLGLLWLVRSGSDSAQVVRRVSPTPLAHPLPRRITALGGRVPREGFRALRRRDIPGSDLPDTRAVSRRSAQACDGGVGHATSDGLTARRRRRSRRHVTKVVDWVATGPSQGIQHRSICDCSALASASPANARIPPRMLRHLLPFLLAPGPALVTAPLSNVVTSKSSPPARGRPVCSVSCKSALGSVGRLHAGRHVRLGQARRSLPRRPALVRDPPHWHVTHRGLQAAGPDPAAPQHIYRWRRDGPQPWHPGRAAGRPAAGGHRPRPRGPAHHRAGGPGGLAVVERREAGRPDGPANPIRGRPEPDP
jgi:hypothetical protein